MTGNSGARWLLLVSTGVMVFVLGGTAQAQTAEVTPNPTVVPTAGAQVRYQVQVAVPDSELPVTITTVSSDLHGDLTDPANPAISSTTCAVPVDWQPGADFGFPLGWGCEYEAIVSGDAGESVNTISVTVVLGDGTEVVVSGVAPVTITGLGSIQGKAIDSATGLPIAGMFVWAGCEGCGIMTDGEGRFAFEGLAPGSYWLKSGNENPGGMDTGPPAGYSTPYAMEYHETEPVGFADPGAATLVEVRAAETTTIQWTFSVGGAIEGMVSDQFGNPIPGVMVTYFLQRDDGQRRPDGLAFSTTRPDGTYRLEGLRGGEHVVCFGDPSSECWDDHPFASLAGDPAPIGDVIPIALGQLVTGIDAVLGAVVSPDDDEVSASVDTLPLTGISSGWLTLAALLSMTLGSLIVMRGPSRAK